MLISLHLPKTGGTSFRNALRAHFGPRLYEDYQDWPDQHPATRGITGVSGAIRLFFRPHVLDGIECVHGHFMATKYLLKVATGNARFITWLRDPVERAASHYYYWQRTYDPNGPAATFPLHQRMMQEDWSLERFCLGAEFRNLYCTFLRGISLEQMAFVGLTEHYDDDLRWFADGFLSGVVLPNYHDNVDRSRSAVRHIDDGLLRKKIARHHAGDMALYAHAVKLRQSRIRR